MMQKQRPSWGTLIGILITGWAIVATVALVGLIFGGCRGEGVPGIGPTITTAHRPLVGPFLQALDVIGDELQANGLPDPAPIVDVTILDGESFAIYETGFANPDLDGKPLWGRNEVALTHRGLRCLDTIALRNGDGEDIGPDAVRPSQVSSAHEAAHCALDVALQPDPKHRDRDVWDRIVPAINARLAEAGL